MEEKKTTSNDMQHVLELGILLGQHRTFGAVAGRCSAAQADSLRRLRDEKRYLCLAANWGDYCEKYLKISRRHVDRLIGWLKEFGPAYFQLSQLTGITPTAFREIAPAIQADGIHVDGEVVALIPENSARAAEAVARLRSASEADPAPSPDVTARIETLRRRGKQYASACKEVAKSRLSAAQREELTGALHEVRVLLRCAEVGQP
jgi:hypothetical protein